MQNRTIKFPSDVSIGVLSLRAPGSREDWSVLAEAIGEVVIPSDKEARLEVSPTAVFEPKIFSDLEPDALSVFEWASTSRVTDAAIAYIQHLTGLQGLALWETNIGDAALRHVRHLSNVRWLDIGDTKITDDGLGYLSELCFLNYLTLLNDRITDDGLIHLQNLAGLEGVDLMNTSLTDEAAETLCKMTQLKTLRIVNAGITEKGYAKLRNALPDCRIRYHHPHHV